MYYLPCLGCRGYAVIKTTNFNVDSRRVHTFRTPIFVLVGDSVLVLPRNNAKAVPKSHETNN